MDDFTHKIKQSFGFLTNQKTRPVILSELIKAVREDPELVCDEVTIQEMLTFVRNEETLRPEAETGAHDDCVLALAIAHFIRHQQSYGKLEADGKPRKWTESMWEDYRNANSEERKLLKEKWGTPTR